MLSLQDCTTLASVVTEHARGHETTIGAMTVAGDSGVFTNMSAACDKQQLPTRNQRQPSSQKCHRGVAARHKVHIVQQPLSYTIEQNKINNDLKKEDL